MKTQKLYQELASLVTARLNCIAKGNSEWEAKHEESIEALVYNSMPSGSGIDRGTKIDLLASTGEKLVFLFSFHHMDENGFYCGWTEHSLIVTPSLQFGYRLKITGRDRNDLKEYLYDTYSHALGSEPIRPVKQSA